SIWGDYNNDGDLDLFVANGDDEHNFLYDNLGNGNHWINIKCNGEVSNNSAIGTKIRVHANINGRPVSQLQEISSQTGLRSQNSLNAEFGLNDAPVADSMIIEWPSGITQRLINVQADQFITFHEEFTSLAISPQTLDFGIVPIGSHKMLLAIITNSGNGDLIISNILISGSNPAEFSYTAIVPDTLPPDSAKQLIVNFSPEGGGTKSANLIIESNTLSSPDTINLAGISTRQIMQKIMDGPVVNDSLPSCGGSWGDFNNDGYIDLFVASDSGFNNLLYRNNGDGTFTQITDGEIVNDGGHSRSASWADFDNDDDLDLFVANSNGEDNFLYVNNGDGSFVKITEGEIVNDGGHSTSAAWGDFDNDGFLDLFVANENEEDNFLYQNNGDGTFSKIRNSAAVNDGGTSQGCNWIDFDNDRDLDLFVANGFPNNERNFLYRNDSLGNFTRIISGSSIAVDAANSMGGSWGDYDNDGDLDLFVTNQSGQNNFLYRNDGDQGFSRISSAVIANDGGNSNGSAWGDFDNDGDLDLFVANDDNQNNFFYFNNGNGTFSKNLEANIALDGGSSRAVIWGDVDHDGHPDLFVSNHGSSNSNNFLYLSTPGIRHWINLKLVGSVSNRTAIGTKVRLKARIRGAAQPAVWQVKE
ncbi:MAG: choice-of-anchor D domain-containing protein, partial [Calditrichae bacterium]|nr:choice-of-anchor D domain-containing protein [Calditrichia bacterium]NIV72101.1 choice-of-anchor D domain-containing protein [Calditrichia bacterium]